jgi:hypothetical protein
VVWNALFKLTYSDDRIKKLRRRGSHCIDLKQFQEPSQASRDSGLSNIPPFSSIPPSVKHKKNHHKRYWVTEREVSFLKPKFYTPPPPCFLPVYNYSAPALVLVGCIWSYRLPCLDR